ncbi:MAG: Lysine exporter protein [Bacteroidetes bacterium]|nr:Lysine exporter protein [Bacteroidota bacterium]
MLLDTIIKGIIIGLSISVPLGPIGMLCIQRTLNHGRKYGFVTGLGASTSDLLYSVITLFFLSFVLGFIEQNRFIIQLIGSLVVIGFGFWIYKSNPVSQPLPNEKPEHSLLGDYLTSFGLTLSNPLILFVLVALFARFEFVTSDKTLFVHIVGLVSVLLGATFWWTVLTYFVSHFRNKFNLRGLKLINRITGGLIILIGIVGTILSLLK